MAQGKVKAIPLQDIDAATINNLTYTSINSAGLDEACFRIAIINRSNVNVTISYDGETDHDFVPSLTEKVLEFQNNASPSGWLALLSKGTVVYVKGAAGIGFIFLSGYYTPRL